MALPWVLTHCDKTPEEPTARASASTPAAVAQPAKPFRRPERVDFEDVAMGTKVKFITHTTPSMGETALRASMDKAMDEIRRIEELMSSWKPTSEVSKINAAPGKPHQVSSDTFTVLEKSLWVGEKSEGTFDITFKTMADLWKFGDAAEDPPKLPDAAEVKKRRKLLGYQQVKLDKSARTVSIPEKVKIGLGGIAKGYAVDKAVAVLRAEGITSFLLQAGGDLYGAGRKPNGSLWLSGIRDPRGKQSQYFGLIELEDRAFSTAGDYARSYVVDGKRYHHIIDPRTGYPATASRSVTIWAKDALTADALDDAVFILGPEKGLELIESMDDVGAVIVDSKNQVHVSEKMKGKVRIARAPTDGI